MPDEIKIITNNQPRLIIEAYELTQKEQEEFDYLDWKAIEKGEESASFVRYKGELYDLGEFSTTTTLHPFSFGYEDWHGYLADTFFSGILIRHVLHSEEVIMGRYYS